MQDGTPIIIKKVKKHGHGHHGGAWKVAYADFVTAMMAFFMVLWILGMDDSQRVEIANYFRNPYPWPKNQPKLPPNFLPTHSARPISDGKSAAAVPAKNLGKIADRHALQDVKDKVEEKLAADPALKQLVGSGDVDLKMTSEGLKIELIENQADGEVFFQLGSAVVRPKAREVFAHIAPVLAASKRFLYVDGHTDSRPMSGSIDNFDLSAQRANAVRHLLTANGVDQKQVREVRGKADTEPRKPGDPTHFSNRRVTVLLPYREFRQPTVNVPAEPNTEDSSALLRSDGIGHHPALPDLRDQVTSH